MEATDVNELVSNAGISIGNVTLTVALQALAILVVGLILIRFLLSLLDRLLSKSASFQPLRIQIRSTVKVLLGILLVLVVLGSLGVQVTSFIALLSVAGVAISLALQSSLSNIASGIMLLTAQPYTVGDYVQIDNVDGMVELIGISYCKLTTVDNREIQIPNSLITSTKIVNYNRLGRRRMDLTFEVSYDTPTQTVRDALMEAMAAYPQILSDPAPEVHLTAYNASSISYIARLWVNAADYWTVNFGVLETAREMFAKHNVAMTYNHLNVHMIGGAK